VTYIKGMVGTYILYLPHMFAVGGAVATGAILVIAAVLSTVAMLLLLECR
jgi:amino acid permease